MKNRRARATLPPGSGNSGFSTLRLLVAAAMALALALALALPVVGQDMKPGGAGAGGNGTCGTCHEDIEDMHPFSPVTCVQCHGGDDTAGDATKAHVQPRGRLPTDERVLGRGVDPAYIRFLDPGNLRVAAESCGPCHAEAVHDVHHSLHATTAGHLGDGLYENGVVDKRHPLYSVFTVTDDRPADVPRPPTAVSVLKQIPGFRSGRPDRVSTHFADLPRKACMQCHLWSPGRAIRGRAGMDGDYRGEGCSACHVPYTDDGLSLSRDRTIDHYEPGHPKEHRMVRFPDTDTCTRCHYGDASIGLSFRGLAQPVPGMPQSPDAPGLHRKRLNGVYYIDDIASTPADVHHQAGMHCVDCHTREDTMGDGNLYTRMEDAIEIRCETCHGTWNEIATGLTKKGAALPHLTREGDEVFLVSRVTGKRHRVKQARHVVRPGSDDFNSHAALAMSDDHARLECYSCHSGWNPNFFGFHFDRNEAFTQLDILSGVRTQGRVTTQEKVFSTFKHYYLGWNSHGRIAPYMVGFSSMATVHDDKGELLLEQALPVTREGLSGMTMIHHQTHTTTARARRCIECHRSPSTFGRGTVNFRLARDFAVTGGARGVRFLSLDRKSPADSALLSVEAIEDVRAIALENDRLSGYVEHVFAATAEGSIEVVNARSPGFTKSLGRAKDAVEDPQKMLFRDGTLYVADGSAGLRIFDATRAEKPREIAHLADVPAYDVHLDPPTLFVAAGAKGVAAIDVRDPREPRVVLPHLDLNGSDTATVDARRIAVLFQYSRPNAEKPEGARTRPRNLAAVGTARRGLWLLDVTVPGSPSVIMRVGAGEVRDLAITTLYELGSEGGAIPTQERDLVVWLAANRLGVLDVTDAASPRPRGTTAIAGNPVSLSIASVYNQPFLQTFVLSAGPGGVTITDLGRPDELRNLGTIQGFAGSTDIAMEAFPLDRSVDSTGAPIMDVSHEGARWLDQQEFLRVLSVPVTGIGAGSGPAAEPLGGRKDRR